MLVSIELATSTAALLLMAGAVLCESSEEGRMAAYDTDWLEQLIENLSRSAARSSAWPTRPHASLRFPSFSVPTYHATAPLTGQPEAPRTPAARCLHSRSTRRPTRCRVSNWMFAAIFAGRRTHG